LPTCVAAEDSLSVGIGYNFQEIALDSEEHGVLRLGEEVLVLEKQILEVPGREPGIVRVRCDLGWVTAEQADGTQMLQPRGLMLDEYAEHLAARLAEQRCGLKSLSCPVSGPALSLCLDPF